MLTGFGQSQKRLLQSLLENKAGLTTDELVKTLGVSRTAVYQHLHALERAGYIGRAELADTGGRPSQVYILTDRGNHLFPKQYALFSNLILASLKSRLGSDGVIDYLDELGGQLAETFMPRMTGKTDLEKITEVVEIMKEVGYETQLDDSGDIPVIDARNCIYHSLAKEHNEVCRLDIALVSTLLGTKNISLDECMVRGGHACRISIKQLK